MKDIYDLGENEQVEIIEPAISIGQAYIRRVPGGWIYTTTCITATGNGVTSCFVPFALSPRWDDES